LSVSLGDLAPLRKVLLVGEMTAIFNQSTIQLITSFDGKINLININVFLSLDKSEIL